MSRKYQGLIVLNTKSLEGGNVDDLVTSVSKEIEAEGAKLDKIEQLGRRQFAYNARHLEAGHYVNYTFEGDAGTVEKVQTRLKLNTHVHIQHYQRIA
jgi:small subunit ribosomal protein S6